MLLPASSALGGFATSDDIHPQAPAASVEGRPLVPGHPKRREGDTTLTAWVTWDSLTPYPSVRSSRERAGSPGKEKGWLQLLFWRVLVTDALTVFAHLVKRRVYRNTSGCLEPRRISFQFHL